jgi:hypothetical protein
MAKRAKRQMKKPANTIVYASIQAGAVVTVPRVATSAKSPDGRSRVTRRRKEWRFSDRNAKLGPNILSFSIAPKVSCPGASATCTEMAPDGKAAPKPRCYGFRGRFARSSFRRCYQRHWDVSKSPEFPGEIIESLLRRQDRLLAFRIHDLGDFYSVDYIEAWIRIVRTCRAISFFAYTRSWVCPDLWPKLRELAAEPNMVLFLSLDRSMMEIPIPPGGNDLPWAYLAVDDSDIPSRPVDVVFRYDWRKLPPLDDPNHFGSKVCPHEDGRTKTTCSRCKFCWRWAKAVHGPVGS